ncbi:MULTISPECIES: phosphomevalonate kinase [Paraliobacillus]|uniref:phosphomevalonate kinase n=1 Tax=Paraliobacillus TaxID=200903 RepID=UPI000DD2B85B|nr:MULTISPECIES: phosphomevalonate kinase [Paraliobacillus]
MEDATYVVKVPGKLMIAGEYAVTEPNQASIVVAVDRYITAKIVTSKVNQLTLPQLGLDHVTWDIKSGIVNFPSEDKRLRFIQNAFHVVYQYLHERDISIKPFHLAVTSELDDPSGKKYGLGSSAAIVVAVVTTMLKLHDSHKGKVNPDIIFKLAAIAHFKTQGNGSCADIAASTYGGWLHYTAFSADWLVEQIHKVTSISTLVESQWPMLQVDSITPPTELHFCVGWTGESAATAPMVSHVQQFCNENPEAYQNFLTESSRAVNKIATGFLQNDSDMVMRGMRDNRFILLKIAELAHVTIETPELKRLANIAEQYGSGKSSGAGGGDCGIAFVKKESQAEKLKLEWEKVAIHSLNLKASLQGAYK